MKTKCMSGGGSTKKMKTGGAAKPKMELGGSLPKAKNGITVRDARTGKHKSGPLSCFENALKVNKGRKFWHEGLGKTIKNAGKTVLGTGALFGAGAVAYKKSTPFKDAVDELKGKLGFNQTGGAVKKYKDGGTTDNKSKRKC